MNTATHKYFSQIGITTFLLLLTLIPIQGLHAHARFKIDSVSSPPPRSVSAGLKTGPCGNVARTDKPTVFNAGQEITVEWEETIDHPGYYRISFSYSNDEGFDNPDNFLLPKYDDTQNGGGTPHFYSAKITLPDQACTECTLQLIQVMTDRSPPSNYYSCADINLVKQDDFTPPNPVTDLKVTAGDSQAHIEWTNPVQDYYKTLILQDTVSIEADPVDNTQYAVDDIIGSAKVIYSGSGTTYDAMDLSNGSEYYFKVYAFDAALNYSSGEQYNVTLPLNPENEAPKVVLNITQQGKVVDTVYQDLGNATVETQVTDPNPADSHTYDWAMNNNLFSDLDNSNQSYTFDPQSQNPGDYSFGVTVMDSGEPQRSTTATRIVQIRASSEDAKPDDTKKGGGGGSFGFLLLALMISISCRRPDLRKLLIVG